MPQPIAYPRTNRKTMSIDYEKQERALARLLAIGSVSRNGPRMAKACHAAKPIKIDIARVTRRGRML
jgi:hypothetical protein